MASTFKLLLSKLTPITYYFVRFNNNIHKYNVLGRANRVFSEVEVTLRLTVGQSVCLAIEHPCGTCYKILLPVGMLLSEICGLVSVGRPFWRENGSAICSVITQWSESLRTRNHTLLSHLRRPNLEGHVPLFISPRNRVAQLYPRALGCMFSFHHLLRIWYYTNRTENTAQQLYYYLCTRFQCLPRHCLTTL
jgi:hypothetical protein